MANIRLQALSDSEVQDIHEASLTILNQTGIMIHHQEVLKLVAEAGCQVDEHSKIACFPERLIMNCISQAKKQYILYGRDSDRTARFGYGDQILMSTPSQYGWIDSQTGRARPATMQDARDAIRLGDALDNITIVGAMAQPEGLSDAYRQVLLTAELVKGTIKPTRTWVCNRQTARYILEIYRTVAGGEAALRKHPMAETFLEPISPLQLTYEGIDVVMEFVQAGQPVGVGPMAMASGTAPVTLAGTIAQENAEILAGIVVTQLLQPGTPVTYAGIPHILDPRTSICSFGSPEQALMAIGLVQMGRSYGFPVYINVGLTDAKSLDAQAGIEKGTSMMLGALAGADMFGHAGICGTDHGASLTWLAIDDELMGYVKRTLRGFEVNSDTLATKVVNTVGPGGNYLAEEHTVEHFRNEFWLPGPVWTRAYWDGWEKEGRSSMAERASEKVEQILTEHKIEPLDEALAREIDRIVECARIELA